MKTRRTLSLLICFCAGILTMFNLLAFCRAQVNQVYAAPQTFFVTPTGSGSTCTQANPCQLDNALALAGNGATIYVAAGTYTSTNPEVIRLDDDVNLYGGWDGVATGAPQRDPQIYQSILDGEDTRRVIYIENGNPVIDGFTITRGYSTKNGGGLYIEGGNPIIQTNIITDNYGATYGSALYIAANGASASVIGNQIINNETPYGGTLIFGNHSHGEIHWNIFNGNKAGYGSAVHTDVAVITYTHNIATNNTNSLLSLNRGTGLSKIINNLFYDNAGQLTQFQNATHALVLHNTFAHCGSNAAVVNYSSVITFTNNIISNCKNESIYVDGTSSISGTNNLFWNNKSNPNLLLSPLVADPKYIAPTSDNFQLSIDSPAIDYGVNAGVRDDLLGLFRPVGLAPDAGAFERPFYIYMPLLFRK